MVRLGTSAPKLGDLFTLLIRRRTRLSRGAKDMVVTGQRHGVYGFCARRLRVDRQSQWGRR
jgi:hypothetical protein